MNKDKKDKHNESNKIHIERETKNIPDEESIVNESTEQEMKKEERAPESSNNQAEIEKQKETINSLEKELSDYKDKLLRKAAEFENYKRRTENDQLNLLTYAAESFITKILPVFDDLERSLSHIGEDKSIDAVKEGLQLVYNKFSKILDEQGVKKIVSVGTPFDVKYHEALMQTKAEGYPPHTVIQEVEAGYMYKDKVIRHSKVIVSDDSQPE